MAGKLEGSVQVPTAVRSWDRSFNLSQVGSALGRRRLRSRGVCCPPALVILKHLFSNCKKRKTKSQKTKVESLRYPIGQKMDFG